MKLEVNFVEVEPDERLAEFARKKVNKLDTFYDRITNGSIFFRKDNVARETSFLVELAVYVPGSTLFSKGHGKSFEACLDSCIEAVRKQLIKYKETSSTY